jgi:hypothetical protein
MTSGKSFSALLLTLFSLAPAAVPAEASVSLSDILRPAEQPQVMRFREEKHLGILDQSLSDTGVLRFIPPATLIREMDGPSGMVYRIQGSQLSIDKGGRIIRQLDLQANPQLAGVAVTLRALLKADMQTLQRQYAMQLTGSEANWTLQLTPRDELVGRIIERISIRGGNRRIRDIDTYETGGDHTHMTLLPNE